VADSLAAIEELVFDDERIGLATLVAAADRDFAGDEALARRLRDRVAKYGQDRGRAERWARVVADLFCDAVRRHRNPRGGPCVPGFWTMTTHVGFGRRLGALPSGRRAGAPLSDGISPANGCDADGPTASMLAAARASPPGVGNGLCLNEKLDPWYLRGEAGTRLLADLTRGYFAAGGMQVQYNVVDAAVLLDAKAHPERHRDLVVRISGYSAYFNDLTDAMKDEIIARTLHGSPPGSGPACRDAGTTP
jgi:formate C-acetyltransferase